MCAPAYMNQTEGLYRRYSGPVSPNSLNVIMFGLQTGQWTQKKFVRLPLAFLHGAKQRHTLLRLIPVKCHVIKMCKWSARVCKRLMLTNTVPQNSSQCRSKETLYKSDVGVCPAAILLLRSTESELQNIILRGTVVQHSRGRSWGRQ